MGQSRIVRPAHTLELSGAAVVLTWHAGNKHAASTQITVRSFLNRGLYLHLFSLSERRQTDLVVKVDG